MSVAKSKSMSAIGGRGAGLAKLRRTVLSNPDKAVDMDKAKALRQRSSAKVTMTGMTTGTGGASAWNVAALRARMSKYDKTLEEGESDAVIHDDEQAVEMALKQIAESRKTLEATLTEKTRQLGELEAMKQKVAKTVAELSSVRTQLTAMGAELKETREKAAASEVAFAQERKDNAKALEAKDDKIKELSKTIKKLKAAAAAVEPAVAAPGTVEGGQ